MLVIGDSVFMYKKSKAGIWGIIITIVILILIVILSNGEMNTSFF